MIDTVGIARSLSLELAPVRPCPDGGARWQDPNPCKAGAVTDEVPRAGQPRYAERITRRCPRPFA